MLPLLCVSWLLATTQAAQDAGSFLDHGANDRDHQVPLLASVPPVRPLQSPDHVGRLPALGWNSWNAFRVDIDESQFLTAANKMISLGLKDAGYEYVNIDDAWSVKDGRDKKTHRLIPDPKRFPEGIKGTADKIHALGMKLGIYSSAGTLTCAGYPASIGYEDIDAETWAEWGVDYLKYDNCGTPPEWADKCDHCSLENADGPNGTCKDTSRLCPDGYDYSKSRTAKKYAIMRDALLAQNRTILYSLCEWGDANVQTWGNDTAHSWRSTGDIQANWPRVKDILNQNSFYMNSVDFWGHADPDMLEVGNGDLTFEECRTHFALWAAMKSPLLIGTPLDKLSQELVEVLKNPYLLAFNQDPVVGRPAAPYKWGTNPDWTFDRQHPAEFWAGPSTNGTLVLMVNVYDDTRHKYADWGEVPGLKDGASYNVIDAWSGDSLGCQKAGFNASISAHDTAVLLVQDRCHHGSQASTRSWPAV